jgi:hypothetical protein
VFPPLARPCNERGTGGFLTRVVWSPTRQGKLFLRLPDDHQPPNGLELSCPAAQVTAHSFSRILAGQARSNLPHASRVSCSEVLGGSRKHSALRLLVFVCLGATHPHGAPGGQEVGGGSVCGGSGTSVLTGVGWRVGVGRRVAGAAAVRAGPSVGTQGA